MNARRLSLEYALVIVLCVLANVLLGALEEAARSDPVDQQVECVDDRRAMGCSIADLRSESVHRDRRELLCEDNIHFPVDRHYWIEPQQWQVAEVLRQGQRNDYARAKLPVQSVLDIEQKRKQLRLILVSVTVDVELGHLELPPFVAEDAVFFDKAVIGFNSATLLGVPCLFFLAPYQLG